MKLHGYVYGYVLSNTMTWLSKNSWLQLEKHADVDKKIPNSICNTSYNIVSGRESSWLTSPNVSNLLLDKMHQTKQILVLFR